MIIKQKILIATVINDIELYLKLITWCPVTVTILWNLMLFCNSYTRELPKCFSENVIGTKLHLIGTKLDDDCTPRYPQMQQILLQKISKITIYYCDLKTLTNSNKKIMISAQTRWWIITDVIENQSKCSENCTIDNPVTASIEIFRSTQHDQYPWCSGANQTEIVLTWMP